MTISSRRLAARTSFGLLCVTLLLGASFLGGGKTSARAYAATPTIDQRNYYCPNEGRFLTIDWTTPMPQNGWLGQANAYPQLVDVQAYDARPLSGGGLNWGFQAQNGSFVCRMYVSSDRYNVSFVNCNNANWGLSSCFAL